MPEKSRKIDKELQEKINSTIPFREIKREPKMCYRMSSAGATYKDDRDIEHPLVNSSLAHLEYVPKNLVDFNVPREISPEDYLEATLAHEYGHIIFNREIKKGLIDMIPRKRGLESLKDTFYSEVNEAYAFWFSELLTGINYPLKDVSKIYEEKWKLNFKNIINMFEDMTAKGKDVCFDYKKLAQSIKKHRK